MSIGVALIAAMVVGLVATLVTIGSQAFFGDTETSVGNVAQAGVMDLRVNGVDDPLLGALLNYTAGADMKPSRFLQPVSVQLTNVGQNNGHLDLHYLNVVPSGGTFSEPECTIQGFFWDPAFAPDECRLGPGGPPGPPSPPGPPGPGTDNNFVNVFFQVDVHDYDPTATIISLCNPPDTWLPNPAFPAVGPEGWCLIGPPIVPPTPLGPPAPSGGIESLCIELGNITTTTPRDILLTFHLHGSADDRFQGDAITFDIEFTLHQRNDPVGTGATQPHAATPGTRCGDNADLPVTTLGGGPPPGGAGVEFVAASSSISEGAASLTVDVVLFTASPLAAAVTVDVVLFTASPLAAAVTVDVVDLLSGSATSGVDYGFVSPETLTFPAGSTDGTTLSVTLSPLDDLLIEGDEAVNLELQSLTGPAVIIAPGTHEVKIIDNDFATLQFDAPTSSVSEGTVSLTVDVRLDTTPGGTLAVPVFVDVNDLLSGSASPSGVDYTYTNATLNFPFGTAGGTTLSVTVFPIVDDLLVEGSETVDRELDNIVGPATFSPINPTTHVSTILDNDIATVAFVSAGAAYLEVGSVPDLAEVRLTIVPSAAVLATAVGLSVDNGAPGTATYGVLSDYFFNPLLADTFPIGAGNGDLAFTAAGLGGVINADSIVEGVETFNMDLSVTSGPATVGAPGTRNNTIEANAT